MVHQIAFFNHKGGVSKTTSAFNLGWKIADLGKRVLIVDCDPQCNLTGLVLQYDASDEYPFDGPRGMPARNIRDALSPAFDARPIHIAAAQVQPVYARTGLFVLPGHVGLAEYENTLSIAHELSSSLSALHNIPGSIRYLIDRTAEANDIEIVIVDMSPSLGALNQNILCTSDSFIVPTAPDFFSAMAIRSLARVLPRWREWAEKASQSVILQEADYPWPNVGMKYLGTIVQNYRRRSRDGREARPTQAYLRWFEALAQAKESSLIPALEGAGLLLDESAYVAASAPLDGFLLEVPDFNSLIAISQIHSKPVFALTQADIGSSGVVFEAQEKSISDFDDIYSQGAERILALVDGSSS